MVPREPADGQAEGDAHYCDEEERYGLERDVDLRQGEQQAVGTYLLPFVPLLRGTGAWRDVRRWVVEEAECLMRRLDTTVQREEARVRREQDERLLLMSAATKWASARSHRPVGAPTRPMRARLWSSCGCCSGSHRRYQRIDGVDCDGRCTVDRRKGAKLTVVISHAVVKPRAVVVHWVSAVQRQGGDAG